MRRLWLCVLVAACLFQTGSAQPSPEVETLIKNAIKALGGEKNLAKFKMFRVVFESAEKDPVTGEIKNLRTKDYFHYPDKLKATGESHGVTLTEVFDGTKGWRKIKDGGLVKTEPLSAHELEVKKELVYSLWLKDTLPFAKDPAFKITALGESKVNGQATFGIKVSSPGHRDVKLYYDTKTNLLAKMETESGSDADKTLTRLEICYKEYKLIQGVKVATKVTTYLNGQKLGGESSVTAEFLDKQDPATFTDP